MTEFTTPCLTAHNYVDINVIMLRIAIETVHDVRDRCLCLASQRAARLLARRFDRAFQSVGLTNNQFSLMMALSGTHRPLISELAPFLGMDRTTLTAALKALERRGLLIVSVDAVDRRGKRPRLTDAGSEVLAAAVPIWRAEHRALEKRMRGTDAAALRVLLSQIS